MLRRAWHVRPGWQQLSQEDFDATLRWVQGVQAADTEEGGDEGARQDDAALTKRGVKAKLRKGPIGLLFISVLQAGGVVQGGFKLQLMGKGDWTSFRTPSNGCEDRSWTVGVRRA